MKQCVFPGRAAKQRIFYELYDRFICNTGSRQSIKLSGALPAGGNVDFHPGFAISPNGRYDNRLPSGRAKIPSGGHCTLQ